MAHALTHRNIGVDKSRDRVTDDTTEHAVIDKGLAYNRYGGFHFGAAFFGWLVTTGLSVILIALLGAAGSAVAVSTIHSVNTVSGQTTATVGIVSGILLLIALAIAYYAGGYVAGRMARFDGARQGFGTWLIGILLTVLLGALGAAAGSKYNVMQQLNLPHLPINQGSFTTGGLLTSLAAIVITLLAAVLGGKAGEGYHRKIDAAAEVGTVQA
jgi:hypothetical protein